MKDVFAALLEAVGFACLVYGAYLLAEWLAWAVGGVVLLMVGNALVKTPNDGGSE